MTDLREKIAEALYEPPTGPSNMAKLLADDAHQRRVNAVMAVASAHVDTMAATIEQQRQRIKELEGENQRMREEVRLKSRAAYLNGINVCMNRLRGQTDVSAVLPALIASRDRAVELHNAALDRARENGEQ